MGKLTNNIEPGIKRNSFENIFDFFARNQYMYIFFLCLSVLPIFIFRDFTPNNELRYVSIVEEALKNGHFITFYNQGAAYADKPPLYFWIIMLGHILFGKNLILFIGVVNLITFAAIINIMNSWCKDIIDNKSRMTAAFMLATTGLFSGMIIMVRMDLLMTMFIVLSLHTFYKMYTGKESRYDKTLFPVYIFLAIFSKGPVGLLMPVICIPAFLLFEGRISTIWRYFGWRTWSILAGLFILWSMAIYIESGKDYLYNIMFHQTVDRSLSGVHHKEPVYYYLSTIGLTMLPWSPLILATTIIAILKRQMIKDSLSRFFLIIIITTFLMLSASSSKLDIYLLPIYPFVLYLTLIMLQRIKHSGLILTLAALPAVLIVSASISLFFLADKIPYTLPSAKWCITVLSLSIFTASISVYQIFKKELLRGITSICVGLLLVIFITSFKIPEYNYLIGWREVCGEASQMAVINNVDNIATLHIARSENMDVYLPNDIIKLGSITEAQNPDIIRYPYVLIIKTKDYNKYKDEGYSANIASRKTTGRYEVLLIDK